MVVDWLYKELTKAHKTMSREEILEKAKEMEKQQIIETYKNAFHEAKECSYYVGVLDCANEYYNKKSRSYRVISSNGI
jgi:hypothetical protein